MNQKEYNLIAEVIRYAIDKEYPSSNTEVIEKLAKYMTLKLEFNYPKTFDRTKFLKACGIES